MKKFIKKAVFVQGNLPRTSVLRVTLIRTVLIPRGEIILGDRLYWKPRCSQFFMCLVSSPSSSGRGCKVLKCTAKGKKTNLTILRASQDPRIFTQKLVALRTKPCLSLACCCSLVLVLEHPGEQNKILTVVMTTDIQFCVACPTYPPTYTVWSWNLGSSKLQFTWRYWHLVFNPGYYHRLR